jgi:hypothetical protein
MSGLRPHLTCAAHSRLTSALSCEGDSVTPFERRQRHASHTSPATISEPSTEATTAMATRVASTPRLVVGTGPPTAVDGQNLAGKEREARERMSA